MNPNNYSSSNPQNFHSQNPNPQNSQYPYSFSNSYFPYVQNPNIDISLFSTPQNLGYNPHTPNSQFPFQNPYFTNIIDLNDDVNEIEDVRSQWKWKEDKLLILNQCMVECVN